jgi:hypothetical protein
VHLGRIERGKQNTTVKMLTALADSLDVGLIALLDPYEDADAKELRRLMTARMQGMTVEQLRVALRVLDVVA